VERAARDEARSAARRAKDEARAAAKQERRRAKAAARAERAAAAQARRLRTGQVRDDRPDEPTEPSVDEPVEPAGEVVDPDIALALAADVPGPTELLVPVEPGPELVPEPDPEPDPEPAPERVPEPEPAPEAADAGRTRETAQQARVAAREQARRDREEARSRARAEDDDHIVEAPRAPKRSVLERLRSRSSGSAGGGDATRRIVPLVAAVIGVLALVCSVVLAVGAFLVALGTDDGNGFYAHLSSVCDALVGPLGDVFSFSGSNAAMKESLVAWGAGSLIYLVVFLVAQTFLGPRDGD
jgi:hypothetical protein